MPHEDMWDIAPFIFPIVSVTEGREVLNIHRFIGTGFWINSGGYFLTCKHVLEELEEGYKPALAQPFGDDRDTFIPVHILSAHPEIDIALCKAHGNTKRAVLQPWEGAFAAGLDISAFGFTDWGKGNQSLYLDVRLLKGHVSRTAEESLGLPTSTLAEVSFASPSGFSGAPLLVGRNVVGMLYGNIESRLLAHTIDEIEDGRTTYKEVSYRVVEYGLAHKLEEIIGFTKQCGVEPFK